MVVTTQRRTIDEQIRMLPSKSLYEIVNGNVVEISPMGMLAGTLANFLAFFINFYSMPRKLGTALVEALYCFHPARPQRRPDVSFVSAEQWSGALTGDTDPPSLYLIPLMAAEVISPSNTFAEIEEKRLEYFEAGIALVWVIHPLQRTIHVYDSPSSCRILSMDDTLDGGTAIPGFQIKMEELFAAVVVPSTNHTNGTP